LDNAIDVGDLVFYRISELWGVEIERDSLVGERFWRDLNQLWRELSDESSAVSVGVKRYCAVWNEYLKRLAAFAEALNESLTLEGAESETANNQTFNVADALTEAVDGANQKDDDSQICELNVFIDWVYRFAAAQVESLRIENELGASAIVLFANGRRDKISALRRVEELAALDRKICAWKFPLDVDALRDRVGAALAVRS